MKLFTSIDKLNIDYIYFDEPATEMTDSKQYNLKYSTDIFELNEVPILFSYTGIETLEKIASIEHNILEYFSEQTQKTPHYDVIKYLVVFDDLQKDQQYCLIFKNIETTLTSCFINFAFYARNY